MGSAATGPALLPTQSQSVPSGSGSYAQAHLSCGQKSAPSIRSCFPYVKERSLEVTAINHLRPLRSYIEGTLRGQSRTITAFLVSTIMGRATRYGVAKFANALCACETAIFLL